MCLVIKYQTEIFSTDELLYISLHAKHLNKILNNYMEGLGSTTIK